MTYIIAKQDNEPVICHSSRDLEVALAGIGMSRGRFTHHGGEPCETAPLYKANGWLAGCIYHVHCEPLEHGKRAHDALIGKVAA